MINRQAFLSLKIKNWKLWHTRKCFQILQDRVLFLNNLFRLVLQFILYSDRELNLIYLWEKDHKLFLNTIEFQMNILRFIMHFLTNIFSKLWFSIWKIPTNQTLNHSMKNVGKEAGFTSSTEIYTQAPTWKLYSPKVENFSKSPKTKSWNFADRTSKWPADIIRMLRVIWTDSWVDSAIRTMLTKLMREQIHNFIKMTIILKIF